MGASRAANPASRGNLRKRRGPAISSTATAYEAIKAAILSNRLRAGETVPAERFERELRLSRTPIREAILQLAREGFIEIRPRMGTFVSRLDLRQIQDMYEARSLLEGRAARLAAARVPGPKLEAVERELQSQRVRGAVDCRALSEAGQKLHNLIVSECGNRVLENMILSLRDHFTRFRNLSLQIPEKVLASHREHLEIVQALKKRDGGLAEEIMQRHFTHAGQVLLDSLLRRDPAGAATVTISAAG